MSTYNFHGEISGPGNFGDHGRIEINQSAGEAQALRLAADLVLRLRTENPQLAEEARIVQGELVSAQQEQRPADRGRIRQALETISLGLTVGGGGLELAEKLGHVLGF